MGARSSWRGAVEVNGIPIHVALYSRIKDRSGDSFKMLAPNGGPVRQQYVDSENNVVSRDECGRGVLVGEAIKPLSPEALDSIGEAERTTIIEPEAFCPLASLPVDLAQGSYKVTPDAKVAGSERAYGTLWNGLRVRDMAYVTRLTMRSGSRDAILAIYAKDDALYAVALPFQAELHDLPSVEVEVDAKAEQVFSAFLTAAYDGITGEFDHGAFTSEWRERRAAAVAAALDGKPIPVADGEKPEAPAGPDLMAALEAAVQEAGKGKAKPAAKRTRKAPAKRSKAKAAA